MPTPPGQPTLKRVNNPMPSPAVAFRIATTLAPLLAAVPAAGFDVHGFWDSECSECHGDAGAFAGERLSVDDGRLVSAQWGEELARFLATHHMNEAALGPMLAMLTAQATPVPVYDLRCAECHGPAADLVARSILWRDGRLITAGGTPLDGFLVDHGALAPDEIPALIDRLEALADDAGQ